jgi:hypothetical protein
METQAMCKSAKFGFVALVLLGVVAIAPVAIAEVEPVSIETIEGEIHEIDYATLGTIISGVSYRIALDAKVGIGGSFGAPTMLTPGMNVVFTFHRYEDGERVIVVLDELPSGTGATLF